MFDPIEPTTLAGVMDELTGRGFTEHFTVAGARLRGVEGGGRFAAEDVTIAAYYRFEGISDPDDMSILYALETRTGIRGTLADAFGVYADPSVGDFMDDVATRRRGPPVG